VKVREVTQEEFDRKLKEPLPPIEIRNEPPDEPGMHTLGRFTDCSPGDRDKIINADLLDYSRDFKLFYLGAVYVITGISFDIVQQIEDEINVPLNSRILRSEDFLFTGVPGWGNVVQAIAATEYNILHKNILSITTINRGAGEYWEVLSTPVKLMIGNNVSEPVEITVFTPTGNKAHYTMAYDTTMGAVGFVRQPPMKDVVERGKVSLSL